jgi:L-lactate dehydrogenase complex protein LldG
MSSREQILRTLRSGKPPFQDAPPRPERYLPVTRLDQSADPAALLTRFTEEIARLGGRVYPSADQAAAIATVLSLLGEAREVLVSEELPLPGLVEALAAKHVRLVAPHMHGENPATAEAGAIPVGITGVEAAFATTGTLALSGQRLPSLLPPVYLGLLPRERLLPRPEDWLAAPARAALNTSRSVALLTGPSRTGDIELKIVIGVHGPREVHVIIY